MLVAAGRRTEFVILVGWELAARSEWGRGGSGAGGGEAGRGAEGGAGAGASPAEADSPSGPGAAPAGLGSPAAPAVPTEVPALPQHQHHPGEEGTEAQARARGRGGSPRLPPYLWAGSRVARGQDLGGYGRKGSGLTGKHRAAAADTQQEVCGAGRERATGFRWRLCFPGLAGPPGAHL